MTLNRIFRESEFTVTRLKNGFGLVDECQQQGLVATCRDSSNEA
jgi:hypothetical protein